MVKKTTEQKKLSTDSYKGVRDFYPEDMYIEKYIFDIMRRTAESFGYIEYNASILEPAELYKSKTSQEIVNEQTYTFTDRGDREVTLRPEMTPTVARMIAGKRRELSFPLRWYSIPNVFRYEQPQKGRLREHWQLNVDAFGIAGKQAEIEVVSQAYQLLKNFGADDSHFEIRINDRRIISALFDSLKLSKEKQRKLAQLIDKKEKLEKEAYEAAVKEIVGASTTKFLKASASGNSLSEYLGNDNEFVKNLVDIIENLSSVGVKNIIFDPSLMRGFDYYTGFVFEIFDTDPSNKRSLFGGGRYDELMSLFGEDLIPAVGFGAGDVTIRDFLEAHKLLPEIKSKTHLVIAVLDDEFTYANIVAEKLRDYGLNVLLDVSDKGPGDKVKKALKENVRYIGMIGKKEVEARSVEIKNLDTRATKKYVIDDAGLEAMTKEIWSKSL